MLAFVPCVASPMGVAMSPGVSGVVAGDLGPQKVMDTFRVPIPGVEEENLVQILPTEESTWEWPRPWAFITPFLPQHYWPDRKHPWSAPGQERRDRPVLPTLRVRHDDPRACLCSIPLPPTLRSLL